MRETAAPADAMTGTLHAETTLNHSEGFFRVSAGQSQRRWTYMSKRLGGASYISTGRGAMHPGPLAVKEPSNTSTSTTISCEHSEVRGRCACVSKIPARPGRLSSKGDR